jgi:hypothetical protein
VRNFRRSEWCHHASRPCIPPRRRRRGASNPRLYGTRRGRAAEEKSSSVGRWTFSNPRFGDYRLGDASLDKIRRRSCPSTDGAFAQRAPSSCRDARHGVRLGPAPHRLAMMERGRRDPRRSGPLTRARRLGACARALVRECDIVDIDPSRRLDGRLWKAVARTCLSSSVPRGAAAASTLGRIPSVLNVGARSS